MNVIQVNFTLMPHPHNLRKNILHSIRMNVPTRLQKIINPIKEQVDRKNDEQTFKSDRLYDYPLHKNLNKKFSRMTSLQNLNHSCRHNLPSEHIWALQVQERQMSKVQTCRRFKTLKFDEVVIETDQIKEIKGRGKMIEQQHINKTILKTNASTNTDDLIDFSYLATQNMSRKGKRYKTDQNQKPTMQQFYGQGYPKQIIKQTINEVLMPFKTQGTDDKDFFYNYVVDYKDSVKKF